MKLAIIDLDGVIADSTERFKRADIAKALYLSGTDRPDKLAKEATKVYWQTAFTPELIALDRPMEDVNGEKCFETFSVDELVAEMRSGYEQTSLWEDAS